jgi:valyl-tRNA synthetase
MKTGPVSGQPPPVSAEATEAIVSASEKDLQGQNVPGRDGGDAEAPKKEKTAKERTQPQIESPGKAGI